MPILNKYAVGLVFLLSFSQSFVVRSQYLNNSSFEGTVGIGTPPLEWDSVCGSQRKPDTQNGSLFGVGLTPSNGFAYLEMVCRAGAFNDSTICENQLQSALDSGSCYLFTFDIAYSKSFTDTGAAATPYDKHANLKIFASTASCAYDTMFWQSSTSVVDTFWTTVTLKFRPAKNYSYFVFVATFDSLVPYFGNILVDNADLTTYGSTTQKLDTTVAKGSKVQLNCSYGSSYLWSPSNGLSNASISNPVATVDKPITYAVSITDVSGCSTTETFKINLETTVPTVFTPNNDGLNDAFFIEGLPTNASLKIFNRWGTVVYEKDNYNNEWTGKTTSGKDLTDGVYFYELKPSSGDKSWHGYVQLIH